MKNLYKDKRASGFTIIEVMIVLAIAGLILAIVFFAVPQLQRNARDNQRQSYTTRLKAELDTYASNNAGVYPFSGGAALGVYVNPPAAWTNCTTATTNNKTCYDWYNRYINGKVNIKDPSSGNDAGLNYSTNTALPASPTAGDVYISVGASCSGDSLTLAAGTYNSKKYAVATALDRAGTWYCVDNG
jgi:prepilin-type N-terminal cleavage/methylation domain-containing protein